MKIPQNVKFCKFGDVSINKVSNQIPSECVISASVALRLPMIIAETQFLSFPKKREFNERGKK